MSNYRIFQAQLLAKDPTTPRAYSVVEIPNGQKLVGVQLGNALKDQSAPLLGSIVLVLQLDNFRSYIIMILREPFEFLSTNNQYRGFIPSTGNASQDIATGANPIQDGEIFMEATGPGSPVNGQGIPGFGAHLYLGNSGVAQIESGSMAERLIIGGTGTADDHEVILSADNGFVESNPHQGTFIQSTYNWDSLGNIEFGNVIANPASDITIPVATMNIDALGNIKLSNTTFGTGLDAGLLKIDSTGEVTLSSGTTGVPKATLTLDPVGNINLNNGVNGVARLNDLAVSSTTVDPQFWLFINAIQNFFTVLAGFQGGSPVVHSELGALGAAFLTQSPIAPPSATSQITTASLTVKAGG